MTVVASVKGGRYPFLFVLVLGDCIRAQMLKGDREDVIRFFFFFFDAGRRDIPSICCVFQERGNSRVNHDQEWLKGPKTRLYDALCEHTGPMRSFSD